MRSCSAWNGRGDVDYGLVILFCLMRQALPISYRICVSAYLRPFSPKSRVLLLGHKTHF